MKYAYYPGCSLKGTNKPYEESFLAVCKALGLHMEEIANWNCCGATAYMSINEDDAFALSARNLALAEKQGGDLVAPCAGCYGTLLKAKNYLKKYPGEVTRTTLQSLKQVGLEYSGNVAIRHPLEILVNDVGVEAIQAKVKKSLKGLKVASYYGCRLVRPYALFDDKDDPQTMDTLMKAVGAEAVNYPLKTKCCGGSLTGTIEEVGQRLCYILLREMKKRGADLVVTSCPLCQFNLEAYQDAIKARDGDVGIPVLYFTQLMGYAMGIPEKELAMHKLIVPATDVIRAKTSGQAVPAGA